MTAPTQELPLRVTAGAEEVELGKAFPLTVVRVWDRDHAPHSFDDASLAPLQVRLESTQTRELDGRDGVRGAIEETRHYSAWAFTLEPIVLPELKLSVRSTLDPAAPGTVELPGELLTPPAASGGTRTIVAVGIELLVIAAIVFAFSRNRARHRRAGHGAAPPGSPAAAPRAAAAPPPEERALSRIARLRALDPGTHAELQQFHVEASALVRDYLDERFGLRVSRMTTEQVVASPRVAGALQDSPRALLARFLLQCDRVKFARHAPVAGERARLLDEGETFVRGSAPT